MRGRPVWLASISWWETTEKPHLTGTWSDEVREGMTGNLRLLLAGVGDPDRERVFRMNLTLCAHRALTDVELAGLEGYGSVRPTHLAGGPIEVLWESEPGAPSTQPCASPNRRPIGKTWYPGDCGRCASCEARATFEATG